MPTPTPAAQKTGSGVDRANPWKEDGNIVLAAERHYFRVHRSILSAYSEVFKDMFDCPHSSEADTELIDLCPVIRLHDAAIDVQMVLKAMYDRRSVQWHVSSSKVAYTPTSYPYRATRK